MTISLDPKQLEELKAMFERVAKVSEDIVKELKRANDRTEEKK